MNTAPKPQKATLRAFLGFLREEIRAQLAIDRTGIVGTVAPARAKAAAWAAIVGVYIIGWGEGIRRAIEMLFEWSPVPDEFPTGTVAGRTTSIIGDVAVVLIAAALIWAFRRYAGATVQAASWRTSIRTFPVGYFVVMLGFGIGGVLNTIFGFQANVFETPHIDDPLLLALNIVSGGMAGPTEELALLALVVVALRATGYRWWTVVAVAIVLRVPFHLYYGWGAIGLGVWAALMVVLYRRTLAIGAIMLEHATFNMFNYAGELGGTIKVLLTFAGAMVIIVLVGNAAGRREKEALELP